MDIEHKKYIENQNPSDENFKERDQINTDKIQVNQKKQR